jgi:sugar phosphate isomerase/epimerase
LDFWHRPSPTSKKAGRLGFSGIELSAGAFGVMSEGAPNADAVAQAKALCAKHNVEITALAFYDLAWTPCGSGRPFYGLQECL